MTKQETDKHLENINKCSLIRKNYTLKNLSEYDNETKQALLGNMSDKDAHIDPQYILIRPFTTVNENRYGEFEFDEQRVKSGLSTFIIRNKVLLLYS